MAGRRGPRYSTWYEPLDEQWAINAAVAFALAQRHVTGICTPGDVRLLPMLIEAENRAGAVSVDAAASELARVSDLEPPFVRVEGRVIPEWLEPLLPST